jgi:hypothetical protein
MPPGRSPRWLEHIVCHVIIVRTHEKSQGSWAASKGKSFRQEARPGGRTPGGLLFLEA